MLLAGMRKTSPDSRVFAVLCLLLLTAGCVSRPARKPSGRAQMLVTAYCPCGKCCGWKRNWYGRPVHAYGPNKGRPKKVGVCADGSKARKGTIAADTRYYPIGTRLYVPGYGCGTVRDRGGAIQGPAHIDIFFTKHKRALRWGRQTLPVTVYPPR